MGLAGLGAFAGLGRPAELVGLIELVALVELLASPERPQSSADWTRSLLRAERASDGSGASLR